MWENDTILTKKVINAYYADSKWTVNEETAKHSLELWVLFGLASLLRRCRRRSFSAPCWCGRVQSVRFSFILRQNVRVGRRTHGRVPTQKRRQSSSASYGKVKTSKRVGPKTNQKDGGDDDGSAESSTVREMVQLRFKNRLWRQRVLWI